MRTIFITPLLWKKLDRAAIRRGEEGQALVLIAFVIIAMVGMVGLAIDGGLGYLESVKLQRAADAAALAGVPWIPENRAVADGRARLSAEANGVQVACPVILPDTTPGVETSYEKRCRSSSWDVMTAGTPGQYFTFESDVPQTRGIQYRVTLGKMQQRFFLGVLGFPNYPIVRVATASYSRLVRFGSSFNYYGTQGVLYDHYMRCDANDLALCGGNITNNTLNMYGATYQKYIVMRCNQANPPNPCIGGFWGHISGPSLKHSSGDAFNPIKDGANETPTGSNILGKGTIGAESRRPNCLHTSEAIDINGGRGSWFVNNVFARTGGTCPQIENGVPVRNQDYHLDRPTPYQGFGYEIAVQVDPGAIWKYADTVNNVVNHTNLNITIYDGGMSETGESGYHGTGDNYQNDGDGDANTVDYLRQPYWNFKPDNFQLGPSGSVTYNNILEQKKLFVCSPGTTGSHCGLIAQGPSTNGTDARPEVGTGRNSMDSNWRLVPDTNNFNWTYNDMRTRFTLYAPPTVPSIPSTYANVQGNYIGSFEVTDMSVRNRDVSVSKIADNANEFCYVIFDDVKTSSFNLRPAPSAPENNRPPSGSLQYRADGVANNTVAFTPATGGKGPDYAYQLTFSGGNAVSNPAALAQNTRYNYICGPNGATKPDFRWNMLKGTPTARYGTGFINGAGQDDRSISKGILEPDPANPNGYRNIEKTPLVTGSLSTAGGAVISTTANPATAASPPTSIWDAPRTGWTPFVDPIQDCRSSAIDWNSTTGRWPIDPMWGHNRIPFNMAYGDPLVNKAWITNTSWIAAGITNPLTTTLPAYRVAGYYTLYYSFHGWRCDWDFDSNYTFNPRKNATSEDKSMVSNPSLSMGRRTILGGTNGKWDRAFTIGHPGLVSNSYMKSVLQNTPAFDGYGSASNANQNRETLVPGDSPGFLDADFELGLEPYFHLTNVAWNPAGQIVADPTLSDNEARVRPGVYMLHVQVFGGSGANRYSVKAEYENPRVVTETLIDSRIMSTYPVPNVFAVTSMAIYVNAQNPDGITEQNVIFDLASIPSGNAGTQATLQIFDTGDVSGDLDIEILEPSGWGPRISAPTGTQPKTGTAWNWQVMLGDKIPTRIRACHYSQNVMQLGITGSCYPTTFQATQTTQAVRKNNSQSFNDQWIYLDFTIPPAASYATWQKECAAHSVPENLCYYYQINYKIKDYQTTKGSGNDTTTWQLLVQSQPIHLVID